MCLQHDWLIVSSVWRGSSCCVIHSFIHKIWWYSHRPLFHLPFSTSSAHPLWRDDERTRTTYDDDDDRYDDDGHDDDGHVDGNQVRNMIYGLKGMKSDQPRVLAVLVEQFWRLIDDCEGVDKVKESLHNDRLIYSAWSIQLRNRCWSSLLITSNP